MTYTIKENAKYGSKEIYFDAKPEKAVLDALRSIKFRWSPKNGCWYGFSDEHTLVDTIQSAEPATIITDGYLGGGAIYGNKSNLHLYGADLAKAIRADLKAAGIKGVTIASKGGNIQATITLRPEDAKSLEEFAESYEIRPSSNFIYIFDEDGKTESISTDLYYTMDAVRQNNLRKAAACFEYETEIHRPNSINHYHLDKYTTFSAAGMRRIQSVIDIISSYRYDGSNSMVDYFDTNFYFDVYTKPAKQ